MVAISCCHEFYEQFARNHINDSMGSAEISFAVLFFFSPFPPPFQPLFMLKRPIRSSRMVSGGWV